MKTAPQRGWMTDMVLGALVAGLLSGLTTAALDWLLGSDVLGWLAARIAAPESLGAGPLLLGLTAVHGGLSLFWAGVLCRMLPRWRPIVTGAGAGLAIFVLDAVTVGRLREAPDPRLLLSLLVGHLVFGASVGAVVGWRRGREFGAVDTAAEEPLGFGLPRWLVETSFAMSLVGYLGVGAIYFHVTQGDTLVEGAYSALFSLAFPIIGIVGGVVSIATGSLPADNPGWVLLTVIGTSLSLVTLAVSVRKRRQLGWFICAHLCLVAYYWIALTLWAGIRHDMAC